MRLRTVFDYLARRQESVIGSLAIASVVIGNGRRVSTAKLTFFWAWPTAAAQELSLVIRCLTHYSPSASFHASIAE